MTVKLVATVDDAEAQRVLARATPDQQSQIIPRALRRAAYMIQIDATRNKIQRGGSGPPNPPPGPLISRTGSLRRSIRVDDSGVPRFIDVGTDLVYGVVHEIGGDNVQPRPFLQPALETVRPQIARVFEDEWNKVIERRG